ncbi:MAG: FAD-binding protein, partial [Sinobacteraceae bacterium]|nr:FAD-binding protein [Nevskiaceae bacterium]
RRGVIFTTGGFAHNKTLTREFLFGPVYGSCAVDASTGDFVQIGADLGSPLGNMNYPWMAPMPLERALWANHDDPTIMCMFAPPGDSMIMVNRYGKRVVNEKVQYNEQMQVFQVWDPMRLEYPNLVLFMIWDEATRELFAGELLGNPIAPEGADAAHIVRADTLEGLQDAITEKLQQLSEYLGGFTLDDDFSTQLAGTVARYNGYARDGHDPEFHRGEQPIQHYFNQFNGPPRPGNDRNPLMYPFRDSGPYYATLLAPATLDTKGGPTINRNAQVVDRSGTPIPGLYGAGNCVASPSGKAYWAGGATIGCAFTFGHLAGKHAAAQPERAI